MVSEIYMKKNLVPETLDEMPLANHIARFLNQLYLQNEIIKLPDFLHIDRNSWKLKVYLSF